MNSIKVISFIIKNIINIFKCKFEYQIPKKNDILLFDRARKEFLHNLNFKYNILDIRLESINIPTLKKTYQETKFNNFSKNYIKNYILFVKPKVIITFSDYNPTFFILKEIAHPYKLVTIAIQSSLRNKNSFKAFSKNRHFRYKCDYYLFIQKFQKEKLLKENIKAKFINIGSFRNNSLKIRKREKSELVLYISQFQEWVYKKRNEEYKKEIKILKWLSQICKENDLRLKIAIKSNIPGHNNLDYNSNRKLYLRYFNFLNKENIVSAKGKINNYNHVDEARIIIFESSTLGLEALSRGKKVLAYPTQRFSVKKNDFFWSTKYSKKKFNDVFLKILKMKNSKWQYLSKKSQLRFIRDESNLIFVGLMKKILD